MEKIYGLMITGKDDNHLDLALCSVKSFLSQTYGNKELIIINDGDYSIIEHIDDDRIKEIKLSEKFTLGELRNLSLDNIPSGALWVQWDDDDWHHEDFIQEVYEYMLSNKLKVCTLKNQVRYAFKINNAWTVSSPTKHGIEGTVMAYENSEIRYQKLRKGEDTYFIFDYLKMYNDEFGVYNNKSHLYLRFIHGYNTWDDDHFYLSKKTKDKWSIPNDSKVYLKEILNNYSFLK